MHTHSNHSTDSKCPLEDMAKAQKDMGATIFAVTDHFDMPNYVAKKAIKSMKKLYFF